MAEPAVRRAVRRSARPCLIDLYLVRSVAAPFLPVLLAVTAAMMIERSLRLIQELAASGSDIAFLGPMLLRLLPYYLDLALPAAFTAALVLAFARLDERLELEAMLASGLSLARIAAPLVGCALVVASASLAVGGWLDPHGRYGYRALRIEALNAGRIGQLQPRALYRPSDRIALTFDARTAEGGARGLFVWQLRPDGEAMVLTAGAGWISPDGRLLAIDLGAGRSVAWRPARPPRIVEFRQLALREPMRIEDASWARGWDQKELTLSELVAAESNGSAIPIAAIRAEIYGRIAHAAINLLLPLLILPLAFATKKGRRTLGLLVGIVLLASVHHGLNFAKNLALGGAGPLWPTAAVIGAFAAIALAVFVSGRHLPSHAPIHDLMRPVGHALAGLRPRPRESRRRGGGTLFAYLAGQLGKWTITAWIAIALLLQIVDLFERSEQFAARGLGLADMARYAALRFAPTLQQALPIAALAGAMIAFASLGRSREMTAIRAAGLSQWRILAMALPVPAVLALAAFLLAETAAPASQQRFAAWWETTAPARADAADAREERWFRIGGEIVRAGSISADGARLDRVEIFRRTEARLSARIAASQARFESGGWTLRRAQIEWFDGAPPGNSDRLAWRTPLQPEDVATQRNASPPSSAAAYRSLSEQAPMSRGPAPYETRIHRAFAEPMAALVMLLLALPLAFAGPRTGAGWPAMLYAGAGGLLYLVGDGVLTVAAQVGYLPAAVGAWTAPAIGVLMGLTVLLYSER